MINNLTKSAFYTLLSILFFACSDDEDFVPLIAGEYEGYYYHSTPTARTMPVPLSLSFDMRNYSGISEDTLHQSVFMGQFNVDGNEVTLTNGYNAVAESNWSHILSGTYTYEIIDETIHMSRDLEPVGIEGFRLKKKGGL